MKKLLLSAMILVLMISVSCKKKELIPGTYNSNKVNMGAGKAYSWVTFDKEGKPVAVGFTLNDAALTELPDSASHGLGHNHNNTIELPLPPEVVSMLPFNHIGIDFNPNGHEPKPIYAAPHFDFHFYMMSSADRKKIPTYFQDSTGFKNLPHADYFPANYINPPPVVAAEIKMGTHWIDLNTPELQPGGVFTETFVYGSYAGKVNFIEPMMTLSFFKAITSWSRSIPQPAKVQISGFYPKKLTVTHSNGEYKLTMDDMYYRVAQ